MFECWPTSTINYALGLFVGWWIWGRRVRALRAAVERCQEACAEALAREVEIGRNLDRIKTMAETLLDDGSTDG